MLLVTGSYGQLGNELRLRLGDAAVYVDRDELDITDENAMRSFFAGQSFDFVINCAAYTAVDKAEDDFKNADRINRLGPFDRAIILLWLENMSYEEIAAILTER